MPPRSCAATRSCADRLDTVPGESAVSPLSLSPPATAEAPSKPSIADASDHTREVASRQPVVSGRRHRVERCHRPGLTAAKAPPRDQVRTMALPGRAGTTAVPASSALIVRARAFRAWLEPLIPSLRRARLDTGFPAAASLLAATRAWLMSGLDAAALASWSCCGVVVVPAGGPDPARGAWGAACGPPRRVWRLLCLRTCL